MRPIRLNHLYLACTLAGLLFSGCFPDGCLNRLPELPTAKANISPLLLTDDPDIDPATGKKRSSKKRRTPLPPPPSITPVCKEFVKMRQDDNEIVIFVDGSQHNAAETGETWETATPSVAKALATAFDIREKQNSAGTDKKQIHIVVAGGNYTHEHEFGDEPTARTKPILNFDGHRADILYKINVLGGYRNGDACLERHLNVLTDPKKEDGRETILDGQNGIDYSNHVIYIAGSAEHIAIKNFTIRNGRALTVDGGQLFKQYGGAVLIRTATKDITLEDLVIERAQANLKGGCVAIFGDAHPNSPSDIKLKNVKLDQCEAVDGGGGLYLGGHAHTITSTSLKITNSVTTNANGTGGGLLIEGDVGRNGAAMNIAFFQFLIDTNRANSRGGGISIEGNANNISFTGGTISGNRATDANSRGGGLYIGGVQLLPATVDAISFFDVSVSGNFADEHGAGIFLGYTAVNPPVPLPGGLPAARFSFRSVDVSRNTLEGAAPAKRGAGFMILGPTSDVAFHDGSISNNIGDAEGIGLAIVGQVNNVDVNGPDILANTPANPAHRANGNGVYVRGDALPDRPARIEFRDTKIKTHVNGARGAGLYAINTIALHLEDMTFDGNQSSLEGGAMALDSCNTEINANNTFLHNTSQRKGGAFYVNHAFDNTLLANMRFLADSIECNFNTATQEGGCLAADNIENAELMAFTASNNTAGTDGGAGHFDNNLRRLYIGGYSSFNTNTAANGDGGALSIGFSPLYLASELTLGLNTVFSSNNAVAGGHMGGALFVRQAPTNIDTSANFTQNHAHAAGGAIHITNPGATNLDQLVIDGTLSDNDTVNGDGGALFLSNNITLVFNGGAATSIGGKFLRNKARGVNRVGGAIAIMGPIQNPHLTRFKLEDATFNTNEASSHNPAVHLAQIPAAGLEFIGTKFEGSHKRMSAGCGGLMDLSGAVIADLLITGGKITGSETLNGDGGAFCVNNITGQINLTNTTLQRNEAKNGSGGFLFSQLATPGLDIRLSNTTVSGNKALNGDGGFIKVPEITNLRISGGVISGNEARVRGGAFGFFTVHGNIRIKDNAQLMSNIANTGDGGFLVAQHGAALDLAINAKTVSGNKAYVGNGGFIAMPQIADLRIVGGSYSGNTAHGEGGVIAIAQINNLTIDGTSFWGNIATTSHGGVLSINNMNDFAIDNSAFASNSAGGNGGVIRVGNANTARIEGGVGSLWRFFISLMRRKVGAAPNKPNEDAMSRILSNHATLDGGAFFFGSLARDLVISELLVAGNSARNGGAIHVGQIFPYVAAGNNVTITSTYFGGNTATTDGGALHFPDLGGVQTNMTMIQNDGPGMLRLEYVVDRAMRKDPARIPALSNSLATNNLDGLNKSDRFRQQEGMFLVETNTAQNGRGGAVFANNVNDVTFENMSFANNSSTNGPGGTIFLNDVAGQTTLRKSIVYGGKAHGNAGGIFLRGVVADTAELVFDESSVQASELPNPGICRGAAGVYADHLSSTNIVMSNFFDNVVANAQPGSRCAAVMQLENLLDQNGALNIAGQDLLGVVFRQIEVKGNHVNAYDAVDFNGGHITGTFLIPAAIYNNVGRITLAPNVTPFDVANNTPESPNAANVKLFNGFPNNDYRVVLDHY